MTNDLFRANRGLVYAVFNDNFGEYRWIEEDLLQEGMIALLKASKVYLPDSGPASFSTFAYKCIRNAMLSYVEREKRTNVSSLSDVVSPAQGPRTLEETVGKPDEPTIAELREVVLKCARTSRERYIIELRLEGKTQRQIACILRISEVRVSEILRELKPIVEQKLK